MVGGEDGENSRENLALVSMSESPTSARFNIDQIPHTFENFTNDDDINIDDEAVVDPKIIQDEPKEVEEEEDGEDLFHRSEEDVLE